MSRRAHSSRFWLWIAFLAVQLWLCLVAVWGAGYALGDVYLYRWWAETGLLQGHWVGLNEPWVYPILALAPIVAAAALGSEMYIALWLVMIVALNAVALGVLTGWAGRPRNLAAGWWWTIFLLLLGPISVGRIDAVTVPLAIIAVTVLAARPFLAGVLLAAATWIKVWPAALLVAIVVTLRGRWRVILGAVSASVAVAAIAIALGGAGTLLSFVSQQTGRGLQIEAPVSAPWLWMAIAGVPGAGLYYDKEILTYQVQGPGVDVVAQLMTPLLALVTAAIIVLAVVLLSRGSKPETLLPPLALALVTALIAVNKVGSPQFISWLAVPIVLALISQGARRARPAAILVLAIAGFTQIVYPYLYGYLLILDPLFVAALTVRNVLLIVLLVLSVRAMIAAPRSRQRA